MSWCSIVLYRPVPHPTTPYDLHLRPLLPSLSGHVTYEEGKGGPAKAFREEGMAGRDRYWSLAAFRGICHRERGDGVVGTCIVYIAVVSHCRKSFVVRFEGRCEFELQGERRSC